MTDKGTTNKLCKKEKKHWLLIQILSIMVLLISTILYICPLKYVQVWEHQGAYYSVFYLINVQYQWILITSIILNLFYILYSCCMFVKISKETKVIFKVLHYVIFILCIIFISLTFVFAFIFSNNYPKAFGN